MTPPRVSAPAEGKDIPMRDQQNRNARRKRLLRQILRLAGMAVLAAVVVFLAIRVVDALRSGGVLCGFGSPTAKIDLEYQDAAGATQTLRYTIGGTVPAGDGRCLRLGDDRTIFAVTAESAAAVLALGDLAA